VLVALFVVLGIAVYQFTAPPPPPGSTGFSVSGLLRGLRRGVQGPRETATADSLQTVAVPASAGILRINIARVSDVTITGEDRADVTASLRATGRGYDRPEADAAAHGPRLKIDTTADAVAVSIDFTSAPQISRTQPPPTLSLTIAIPRRLAVRVDPHIGRFVLANVASAEIMSSRGETKISDVGGSLKLTHNGGAIEIASAGSLKLNARNSRGTVKGISGPVSIDGVGGDLALSEIDGPLEIEARNTDVKVEADTRLKPPLRINMNGGTLRVTGLRTEARLDGRNTEINVALDAPAPLTIYNAGEIIVTPPSGGYTLDAAATEGGVTVEDGEIAASEGPDPHAEGKVRGGGPTITLRATRGHIEVRKPAGK